MTLALGRHLVNKSIIKSLQETQQRADAKTTLPSTDFSSSPLCPVHLSISATQPLGKLLLKMKGLCDRTW